MTKFTGATLTIDDDGEHFELATTEEVAQLIADGEFTQAELDEEFRKFVKGRRNTIRQVARDLSSMKPPVRAKRFLPGEMPSR